MLSEMKGNIKKQRILKLMDEWKKVDEEEYLKRIAKEEDADKIKKEQLEKRNQQLDVEEKIPIEEEKMDKQNFLVCVARMCKETDHPDELIDCFKMFDKNNTGFLSEAVLRYILCNMGDKFADDEVDLFIKECNKFLKPSDPSETAPVKLVDYTKLSLYFKDLYKPETA